MWHAFGFVFLVLGGRPIYLVFQRILALVEASDHSGPFKRGFYTLQCTALQRVPMGTLREGTASKEEYSGQR